LHQRLHPFAAVLELLLDLHQLLAVGLVEDHLLLAAHAAEAFLAVLQVAGQFGHVTEDRAQQRQGGVGLLGRKKLLGTGGTLGGFHDNLSLSLTSAPVPPGSGCKVIEKDRRNQDRTPVISWRRPLSRGRADRAASSRP